jgi:hypothetical protein
MEDMGVLLNSRSRPATGQSQHNMGQLSVKNQNNKENKESFHMQVDIDFFDDEEDGEGGDDG